MKTVYGLCCGFGQRHDILVPSVVFVWSVAIFLYSHYAVHSISPHGDIVFSRAYQSWAQSQNLTSNRHNVHLSAKIFPMSTMPSIGLFPYQWKTVATKLVPYKDNEVMLGFQRRPNEVDLVRDYLDSWRYSCKGRKTLLVQVSTGEPAADTLLRASLGVALAHFLGRVPIFYDTTSIEQGMPQYRRAPLCTADALHCFVQDSSPCSAEDVGAFNRTGGTSVTLGGEAIQVVSQMGDFTKNVELVSSSVAHVSFMSQTELLKEMVIFHGFRQITAIRSGGPKALFHAAIGSIFAFVCRATPEVEMNLALNMHRLEISRPYVVIHLPTSSLPQLLTNAKAAMRIRTFSAGISTAVLVSNHRIDTQWSKLLNDKNVVTWTDNPNDAAGTDEQKALGRLYVLARSSSLVLSTVESAEAAIAMFLFHGINGFSPRLVTLTGVLGKLTGNLQNLIPY